MTDATTLDQLRTGGKRAIARALAGIERMQAGLAGTAPMLALLDAAYANPRGHVLGFTGPPGVGKSTLVNALIQAWRGVGQTVGVIAVDPSSQRTGGALLGDRARMSTDAEDQGVFVRSLAARGRLGGLAELAFPAMVVMRAVYDRVLIETVGVGQSEAEITSVADTIVFCVQPGSGDSLQFMKAGIMELPDIAVVTKADMGGPAMRAQADFAGALSLAAPRDPGWTIPVSLVSSTTGAGVGELISTLDRHRDYLSAGARLAAGRSTQAEQWLEASLAHRFGTAGLSALANLRAASAHLPPFARHEQLRAAVTLTLSGASD